MLGQKGFVPPYNLIVFYYSFLIVDQPTTSSITDEHSCTIREKLCSSSGTNVDLGKFLKISRSITTLRAASCERQDGLLPHLQAEFVYVYYVRLHVVENIYIKKTSEYHSFLSLRLEK